MNEIMRLLNVDPLLLQALGGYARRGCVHQRRYALRLPRHR